MDAVVHYKASHISVRKGNDSCIFITYLKACCKRMSYLSCFEISGSEGLWKHKASSLFLIRDCPLVYAAVYFTEDKLTEGFSFITSKELYINR